MKKLLLLTAALFAFVCNTYAQDMKFGLRGGLNISGVTGKDVENADSKIGVQFGVFGEYEISDQLSIQPELVYSIEGYKGTNAKNDDVNLNLSYINLPILFKYYVIDGLSLQAGPQIGYLARATFDGESEIEGLKIADRHKDLVYSLAFGGGYDINDNLSLDARFTMGLNNFTKEFTYRGVTIEESEAKTVNFMFGVAYRL